MGAVKFGLLHHDGCSGNSFHYRINSDGTTQSLIGHDERGLHPSSLGIVLSGNFDDCQPSLVQLNSLKILMLELQIRYPSLVFGAHRQVRGASSTTCPGLHFPMKQIGSWARKQLLDARDARLNRDVESQYGP